MRAESWNDRRVRVDHHIAVELCRRRFRGARGTDAFGSAVRAVVCLGDTPPTALAMQKQPGDVWLRVDLEDGRSETAVWRILPGALPGLLEGRDFFSTAFPAQSSP